MSEFKIGSISGNNNIFGNGNYIINNYNSESLAMNEEDVIRQEAKEFYNAVVKNGNWTDKPIDTFHKVKHQLSNFYSNDSKGIFLEEFQILVIEELNAHRIKAHQGKPKPDCHREIEAEKLIFYINQEKAQYGSVSLKRSINANILERKKVFISYCHRDKSYFNDVKRHFKPFLANIDCWEDTKIQPGETWKEEIRKAIVQTKVAILLVSTDYLGSDFVSTDELPPLLKAANEDGATILTVILRPCYFDAFPQINKYQTLNPPTRPVSAMDENEREELFVNLVRQTERILQSNI